ncbi:TPA: transcriptional regulator [Salmonella enterica subsp. enterica serovar Thompson]|nr:helix-turn-helix domain-containing protein [Salmonella enterica subsp. enterica serovar Thompson]ECY7949998.1 helix-turn-helix domain-containing protein [Salmonella enterica subsp. enterica serovar Thompson]
MKNEFVEKVISAAGSQKALSELVGHPQSLISAWLNGKRRVSVDAVPLMANISKGEVLPHQLRPDLPRVFPVPDVNSNQSGV